MLGLDVKRTWSWKQRMCGTGILQSKLFGAIIRGSKCLVGAIVLDPIKMLLYDDSVGVFTRHVTNMAVTPSAMAETPCCTQTSRLCPLYVRSYCRLKFVIASIRNFGYLLRKMVENINFSFVPPNWLRWYRNTFSGPLSTVLHVCNGRYTHSRCCFTPIVAE